VTKTIGLRDDVRTSRNPSLEPQCSLPGKRSSGSAGSRISGELPNRSPHSQNNGGRPGTDLALDVSAAAAVAN
jgi:hypothetical protein